jgi:hypothetical protein
MNPSVLVPVVTVGLLLGMLACIEIGYRIGRRADRDGDGHEGLGSMEGAIFALFGLLLAFAFSGATSRLDARRQLIVQEANALGTAYLRLDVVPPSAQPELRRLFREYLEARFHAYDAGADLETVERFIAQATQLQQQIWTRAVAASHIDDTQNTVRIVLPAINDMIDVTTDRIVAARTSIPGLVLGLLLIMALVSALTAGYAKAKRKRRSLLHDVLYAIAVAATVYVVLDIDNPRFGLIRLDATDKILRDLSDSIRQ